MRRGSEFDAPISFSLPSSANLPKIAVDSGLFPVIESGSP
jgi:hypothetical protein